MTQQRLQTKEGICAYLGDISPTTYDKWQSRGLVPGPVRGTNRYDLRAHDLALDRASGLAEPVHAIGRPRSALEEFEAGHAH
ncbi:hypothetical protein [Novosphingobium sp. BW1]|uniref:hypothetical protein n=1 Tax=Novosphingobium sp. BW1 TaxID=2592621 RepID=UPI001396AEF0|nr:hypothetical protein [Novosphingobium sp. BW1]